MDLFVLLNIGIEECHICGKVQIIMRHICFNLKQTEFTIVITSGGGGGGLSALARAQNK